MRRVWWMALVLLWGCGPDGTSSSQAVAARSRPLVNIVPVIDRTQHGLDWDVSQELTQAIRQYVTQHGKLYLVDHEAKLPSHDPFGFDTFWIKKTFPRQEFVAFVELVEHRAVPVIDATESHLKTSLRVRVFDLRDSEPKVILQELVDDIHVVPSYVAQPRWGDENFEISPLGMAHAKASLEIASRVEDYVLMHAP